MRLLQLELLEVRQINKQFKAIVESYYQAWYIFQIESFPKSFMNFPLIYKLVNSFARVTNAKALDTCTSLIKQGIYLNEEDIIVASVRLFMNKARLLKPHKDYVLNRKLLDSKIVQELLG